MRYTLVMLWFVSMTALAQTMHTYSVLLTRVDPKAGPNATLRVEVQAPNSTTAKRMAEAKAPGYAARTAPQRLKEK